MEPFPYYTRIKLELTYWNRYPGKKSKPHQLYTGRQYLVVHLQIVKNLNILNSVAMGTDLYGVLALELARKQHFCEWVSLRKSIHRL